MYRAYTYIADIYSLALLFITLWFLHLNPAMVVVLDCKPFASNMHAWLVLLHAQYDIAPQPYQVGRLTHRCQSVRVAQQREQ